MKTLEASQDALLLSSGLQLVTLVKLTTYTDRAALTVNQIRYLSNGARLYKWAAGAVQQFDPWVISFSGARETMNHIPSSDGSGFESTLRRTRTLVLRNAQPEFPGSFIYKTLRAENLELARIEIAQLFLNPGQSFVDLSNLSGSEMTWVFRGQIVKVHDTTISQFVLDLESELPRIPWLYATGASVDPRDVGKRVPIVYGAAKHVPCIGWSVLGRSVLVVAAGATDDTLVLADASPISASGSGLLGSEAITWTGISSNSLTGVTRGIDDTPASSHSVGESFAELPAPSATETFIIAGHACQSLNTLYVRRDTPAADLIRVPTGFAVNLADTTTVPGATVTSVIFTSAQILALLRAVAPAPIVTQQPSVSQQPVVQHGALGGTTTVTVSPTGGDASLRDGNTETGVNLFTPTGPTSTTVTFATVASITSQVIHVFAGNTYGGGNYELYDGAGAFIGSFNGFGYRAFTTLYTGHTFTVKLVAGGVYQVSGFITELYRDYTVSGTSTAPQVIQEVAVATDAGSSVTIAALSASMTIQLFADVSGVATINVPSYVAGYPFDEGTSWSVVGCTQTNDTTIKTEGASAQKLVASGGSFATRFSMDNDVANWHKHGASVANAATPTQGGGSLQCISSGTSSPTFADVYHTAFAAESWSGKFLTVWVYLVTLGPIDSNDGFEIKVCSSTVYPFKQYAFWKFGTNDGLKVGWTQLTVDLANPYFKTSSFDLTAVRTIQFSVFNIPSAPQTFYLDEIQLGTLSANCAMQRNATAATVDLTAVSNQYRVSVRGDGLTPTGTVRLYFSNTAGSGTTKPASYWKLDISAGTLVDGSFVTITGVATGVGSPATPNNVETVGVELIGTNGTVWVDDLSDYAGGLPVPYISAPGSLLTAMPDILRHVLTDLLTVPLLLDSGWNTTGDASHLDDNAHACDLRSLGDTDADIINRLAFESRANLIQVEQAAGTAYKLLVASNAYSWGSAVATLTQWERITDEGRDTVSVATRFRHLYAWKAELGDGIEAYALLRSTTVTAAEAKFGRRDFAAVPYRTIRQAATMNEIGAYFEQELAAVRTLRRIEGVPWPQGWKLERGDVVSIQAQWETSPLKARVIETTLRADQKTDLRVVEVQ